VTATAAPVRGRIDGTHWDITLRVDVMLPVTIERRQPRLSELRNSSVHALDAAPWQPTPAAPALIDYTDLEHGRRSVRTKVRLTGSARP
jgi:hypothetical protein